jgi:hypothetical protein
MYELYQIRIKKYRIISSRIKMKLAEPSWRKVQCIEEGREEVR